MLSQISLNVVAKGAIGNKSEHVLVQVMTWRLTGDKPLPEPLLTNFRDAIYITWSCLDKLISNLTPQLLTGSKCSAMPLICK